MNPLVHLLLHGFPSFDCHIECICDESQGSTEEAECEYELEEIEIEFDLPDFGDRFLVQYLLASPL